MSQILCKYHPQTPANWACSQCHINYCKSCISQEDTGRGVHCPVCKTKMHSIGAGNSIKPFWLISGKFFLYPLNLYPLSLLIILTILYSQFDPTLMGKLMQFVLSIVFMKYSYAVLEDTALGHLKPLPINSKVINDELDLPFKQIILTFAISAANASVYNNFGYAAVSVTVIITAITFPANVMVLAMEHSFFAAFNPILIFSVIKRIGAAYFLLTFLLLMLFSASSSVMNFLYSSVSYSTFVLISSFINMYFTLIMFHLLGYTLYQYHEELGYIIETDVNDETNNPTSKTVLDPELRIIEILIQEGKNKEANAKLSLLIKENPSNHEAQIHNLKLQQLLGDMDAYNKYAKKYISYLLSTQQISQITKVLPTIFSVNPSFKPEHPSERFELAKLLKQNGQSKAAVTLINNLHIDYPEFKQIPEAYLLASKILCEQLGNDQQATNILTFLLKKFPDSELQQEIKEYLQVVNNLSSNQV